MDPETRAYRASEPQRDAEFRRELVGLIPHLRAFARTLAGDASA
ncbi:MAG: sigma-70 family RNA polymerase sigma factor, partial [Caulobacteraceae bacterium]